MNGPNRSALGFPRVGPNWANARKWAARKGSVSRAELSFCSVQLVLSPIYVLKPLYLLF